jgi:probable HAF family extracellular repeat protein
VHAFIYSAASGKIETVTDSSMVQIRFNGINTAGVVVGLSVDSKATIHPFIYQNGAFTALSLSGLKDIVPLSINDTGVITGFAVSGSTTVGFVATP